MRRLTRISNENKFTPRTRADINEMVNESFFESEYGKAILKIISNDIKKYNAFKIHNIEEYILKTFPKLKSKQTEIENISDELNNFGKSLGFDFEKWEGKKGYWFMTKILNKIDDLYYDFKKGK